MSKYKHTLKKLTTPFVRIGGVLAARPKLFIVTTLLLGGFIFLSFTFWPRHATFAFNEPSCINNPLLLPNLHSSDDSNSYHIEHQTAFSIAGYPVLATRSCISALAPPSEQVETIKFRPFHIPLIYKPIRISAGPAPLLATSADELTQISVSEPINLKLNEPDIVFAYQLSAGEHPGASCEVADMDISCPVEKLGLKQAEEYDITIGRAINGYDAEPLLKAKVATVTPIEIEDTSIESGGTIYDNPDEITITTDKPIASYEGVQLMRTDGEDNEPVDIELEHENDQLYIQLAQPLPRNANFELTIESLTAEDKGFLASPYQLDFETSGGPQFETIDIGSYGISTNTRPTLTFDYPLASEQDFPRHITIKASGQNIAYTAYPDGARVTLVPHQPLPRCSAFTITITDELENRHGLSGDSRHSHQSRTLCQQVSTIGTSEQGRPIQAYRFGNGSQKILYLGGIHGSEPSSKYILDSWIAELEASYERIPEGRTIIVVPNLNPDGILRNGRTNTNGVDLNRNFPTSNWQEDASMPSGTVEGSGGSEPLSESESRAIANFITAQNPRLVLSYHAVGPFVIANDAGNSRSFASQYGSAVGYSAYSSQQADNIFDYEISGALEDWLRESPGIPGMLIELTSYTGNEFWRHREAMWSSTRY